jgi:hypothetical protein
MENKRKQGRPKAYTEETRILAIRVPINLYPTIKKLVEDTLSNIRIDK